jgi:hypothetical protein
MNYTNKYAGRPLVSGGIFYVLWLSCSAGLYILLLLCPQVRFPSMSKVIVKCWGGLTVKAFCFLKESIAWIIPLYEIRDYTAFVRYGRTFSSFSLRTSKLYLTLSHW